MIKACSVAKVLITMVVYELLVEVVHLWDIKQVIILIRIKDKNLEYIHLAYILNNHVVR
jgi:hypothetical protein